MFNYEAYLQQRLDELKSDGRYRYFLQAGRSARHFPVFYYEDQGRSRKAVNFCSNDYLGMSVQEEVIGRQTFVLHQSGTGSGGTRNISGTSSHHVQLEHTLAAWHGKETALLFNGAYLANLTTLQTLGRLMPDMIFLSDERNHASIIEGIRSSGCSKLIFRHNDTAHLESLLASLSPSVPRMVVFESVYSMNGAVAPVAAIINLASRYNALSYVDEVHAIGLYGATGGGICEQEGVTTKVDIINGTLAKAVGVIGGYIATDASLADAVRSFGSGFIFTTSLPPAVCAAAEKSVQLLQQTPALRTTLFGLVKYLRRLLSAAGISFVENHSHITPVIIGNALHCKAVADRLLDEFGVYVQPVNFPTVPVGEECLRLVVTARHSREQILHLVNSLKAVLGETDSHRLPPKQTEFVAG